MPNKQIDRLNYLPKVNRRFLDVCYEIVTLNKLNHGPYKSVKKLCESIDMSQQSFQQIKSDNDIHNVTVAKIANLVNLHNVNAQYLFTGKGAKFNTEHAAGNQLEELTRAVLKMQKQMSVPVKKKK